MGNMFDEFVKKVREVSSDSAVEVRLYITAEGYEFAEVNKTPEELKSSGISIRNLKGEWIV